jgi:hypothetical protein
MDASCLNSLQSSSTQKKSYKRGSAQPACVREHDITAPETELPRVGVETTNYNISYNTHQQMESRVVPCLKK